MNEPHSTSLNCRHFGSLKKFFLAGYNCVNSVVFCCVTKWIGCVFTYILSPLNVTPTPRRHHRALNWAPCAMQQLALPVCFTHGDVYTSVLVSGLFPPPFPPLCPQVHSIRSHLYSCPEDRFISTIFLEGISFSVKISLSCLIPYLCRVWGQIFVAVV